MDAKPLFPTFLANRREQVFPRLTGAQVARIARHASRRRVGLGEVLVELGDRGRSMYVPITCRIEVVRPSQGREDLVAVYGAGEFTGEVDMLSGRSALVRARVAEAGDVLVLESERLRALVQTDSELSEIFMRAFILRRMGLVSLGEGDTALVGSRHSAGTLRIREFLARNAHPYTYLDVDTDSGVSALLDRFQVDVDDVPFVICRDRLNGCVALDDKGFVKTGTELSPDDLIAWTRNRPPFFLEASLPGVFAVGDVRAGSMKRVASSVGEGSTAVAFIHAVLADT